MWSVAKHGMPAAAKHVVLLVVLTTSVSVAIPAVTGQLRLTTVAEQSQVRGPT